MLPGYLKPLFTPQKCSSLTYPLRPYSEAENTEHPLSLTLSPLDIHVWSILEAYQLLDNKLYIFMPLPRPVQRHTSPPEGTLYELKEAEATGGLVAQHNFSSAESLI